VCEERALDEIIEVKKVFPGSPKLPDAPLSAECRWSKGGHKPNKTPHLSPSTYLQSHPSCQHISSTTDGTKVQQLLFLPFKASRAQFNLLSSFLNFPS
jgi:hypothetical protein